MARTTNIIKGMQILLPYYSEPEFGYHTAAEHDVIYMYPTDSPVSDDDMARLADLGWRPSDSDGWEIFT